MTPVQYSAANQVLVDAFERLPQNLQLAAYWSDDAVDPVRAEIKGHYIAVQKYICVYCGRQIVTANKSLWDAEHVIGRDQAPRFMFTPQNLAVSCRDCNIAKGQQDIVTTKRRKFPDQSRHYLIVHPHFDNYADHIRWFGDVCCPKSEKGVKTIAVCDLTRFTAKLLGIHGVLTDPGFDHHVGGLLKAGNRMEAMAALAAISAYVENIPQK